MRHTHTEIADWAEKCPFCGSTDCLDIHTSPPDWRVYLVCIKCGEQSEPRDITQSIRRMLVAHWRISLDLAVAFTPPTEENND